MLLEDAYKFLKRRKLVHSHREFSADFLGRRPRHYDDLICSKREASAAVVASLAMRLSDVARHTQGNRYPDPDLAELELLIARAFSELRRRFVMALPRKRPLTNRPAYLKKRA